MNRNQWIEEVLASTEGLQKAEPSPFLFEQVIARINTQKQDQESKTKFPKWILAASFVIILTINIISIAFIQNKTKSNNQDSNNYYSELSEIFGYTNQYDY